MINFLFGLAAGITIGIGTGAVVAFILAFKYITSEEFWKHIS